MNPSLPDKMKAVAIDHFGGPEVLHTMSLPIPTPAEDEILIKLDVAGIGVWDPAVREGELEPDRSTFPYVIGNDGAGRVVARGDGVTRFAVGDRVYAYTMNGGFYAEYVAVKAESAAKKNASANVDCAKPTTTDQDKTYCGAKQKHDALQKQYDDATKKLAPTRSLISGLFFLVALLVLLIPSLFGGQTLGKRLQGVRLVKLDGSRVGAAEVFRRYGALALAAFASYTFLGPVGPLVIVFVATMWTRNPNRQGLQDRFAKTLVVTGNAE